MDEHIEYIVKSYEFDECVFLCKLIMKILLYIEK